MTPYPLPQFACILAVPSREMPDVRPFLQRVAPAATILSISRYCQEFSDDPQSAEARLGAFQMLRANMVRLLTDLTEVSIDCEGLRDEQVNELRKIPSRHYASGTRLDVTLDLAVATFQRIPAPTYRPDITGPFDVIGDVHGCLEELVQLLEQIGYSVSEAWDGHAQRRFTVIPPRGRTLVFLGDLGDRGPDSIGVFALVMDACQAGTALCVIGNHDIKALRWLDRMSHGKSNNVSDTGGFEATRLDLAREPQVFRDRIHVFLKSLPSHYVLNQGRLAVAHAGVPEKMQGRDSPGLTSFCLYGVASGMTELDANGLPIRESWAKDYYGSALVLHGHTPVQSPLWGPQDNVCCLDTGCVFGGSLTAMRYPERELISVAAYHAYASRPVPEPSEMADISSHNHAGKSPH